MHPARAMLLLLPQLCMLTSTQHNPRPCAATAHLEEKGPSIIGRSPKRGANVAELTIRHDDCRVPSARNTVAHPECKIRSNTGSAVGRRLGSLARALASLAGPVRRGRRGGSRMPPARLRMDLRSRSMCFELYSFCRCCNFCCCGCYSGKRSNRPQAHKPHSISTWLLDLEAARLAGKNKL